MKLVLFSYLFVWQPHNKQLQKLQSVKGKRRSMTVSMEEDCQFYGSKQRSTRRENHARRGVHENAGVLVLSNKGDIFHSVTEKLSTSG